jgi:PKD repeat protein
MMLATVFVSVVPMGAVSVPPVRLNAMGPYGTHDYPYYEGDTVPFSAKILHGNPADYMFRWDVNEDGEFEGPGSAPYFWGAFGETDYSHQYLDDFYGDAKVQAWDGISMKEISGAGDIWGGSTFEQYLAGGYYATHGLKFTVNQDITVDQLGVYREYYPYQYYNIRLWTESGTLLRQVTNLTTPNYSWSWFSISPISLSAGNTYIVSVGIRGYYQSGADNPGMTPDGVIDPQGWVYYSNSPYAFPSNYNGNSPLPLVDINYSYSYLVPDPLEDLADVWVENVAPDIINVIATTNPGYEGIPVDFTASFEDPGLDDTWEYRWDFGDGTVSDWIMGHSGQAKILLATTWRVQNKNIIPELDAELGDFDLLIDTWDWGSGYSGVPDIQKLLEYDVVVVAENYFAYENRDPMGDVLANYSDAGGNVVGAWISSNPDGGVLGRWQRDDYNCIPQSNPWFGHQSLGTVYDPSHPIMEGVSYLSSYYSHTANTTMPDATRLCDLSNGNVFVAYKDNPIGSGGRIVDIQMFPVPSFNSGDYMTLFANCIKWASQKPMGPMSMPLTTLPVEHRYVDIIWDDKEMMEYQAKVEIRDDDHGRCVPIDVPQFVDFEDFETGKPSPSDWPDGWYEGGYGGWEKTIGGYLPSEFGHRARHGYWYEGRESYLYSPIYDFSSLKGIIVDWDQYVRANFGSGDSDGYLEVSVDGGATWNAIYEWHHPLPETTSHETGGCAQSEGSSEVQLRFRCYMDLDYYWEVDNINIMTAELKELKGSDSGSVNVTILPNHPPTANAGGPFYWGFEGDPVLFDASASIDPDGNPLKYRWDFDSDGIWDTWWLNLPIIYCPYPDDLNGQVTVEVTDGAYFDSATADINILNVPPEASISFTPENPKVFEIFGLYDTVKFTGSIFDPGSDSHSYIWDFGDGTVLSGNLTMEHTYLSTGSYTVVLEVTDDDGGIGAATTTVFVSGPAFTVDAGGSGDFLTIQEAVDAAQPYDFIAVNEGIYTENVEITKPLYLFGEGAGMTFIDGCGITHGLTIDSDNVTVSRFTVYNSSGFGVKIESGSANVKDLEITGNEMGIGAIDGSGLVNIHKNWIHNNTHNGLYIENWGIDSNEFHIQYNLIENNGHYGIHLENLSDVQNKIIINYNRDSETNNVTGTPNGIYGQVKGIFIHNSDNVTIMYNTIRGYSEFGIFDYGNENDHNYYNKIQFNTIDGLNRSATVGIVAQYVYTDKIWKNTFIDNGWWGLKSLYPSYVHFCYNWNYWIHNGHNLSIDGEFPSNWPDTNQGNTGVGGAYYFDPPPGVEIQEFLFDGNIMIDNPIGIMVEGATDKLILSNNTIKGSEIAIYVESGDPIIENNRLTHNVEAINISSGSPVIQGNIIDHNEIGITVSVDSNPQIGENVLVHNDVDIISPDPNSLTDHTLTLLEDAKTGDKKIDKRLDFAIDHIQKSLNINPNDPDKAWKKYPLWEDGYHLDPKQGHKVFNEIKKAVKILMKLTGDDDTPKPVADTCQDAIDKLIVAVEFIANTAYEDAQAYSGTKKVDHGLEKCESELGKAEKDLADGHPDKAIDHFRKAWEHAQLAIKHGS